MTTLTDTSFPWPIASLQEALGDLQPGGVYAIAGVTGVGRTTLLQNLSVGFARAGVAAIPISLEMPYYQWLRGTVCIAGGISEQRWRASAQHGLNSDEERRLDEAVSALMEIERGFLTEPDAAHMPHRFDFSGVSDLLSCVRDRRALLRPNVPVVVVVDGAERWPESVDRMGRNLKTLAQELACAVVVGVGGKLSPSLSGETGNFNEMDAVVELFHNHELPGSRVCGVWKRRVGGYGHTFHLTYDPDTGIIT